MNMSTKDNADQVKEKLPVYVPCIEVKDRVVFPRMMIPIEFSVRDNIELCSLLTANKGKSYVMLFEEFSIGNIGILCKFVEKYQSEGRVRLLLNGKYRVRLDEIPEEKNGVFLAKRILVKEVDDSPEVSKILLKSAFSLFEKIVVVSRIPKETLVAIETNKNNTGGVCDLITYATDFPIPKKYKILGALNILNRVTLLITFLEEHIEILNTAQEILDETKDNLDKRNKEFYLRAEAETIKKKLGDKFEDTTEEVKVYEEKINKIVLPEEALKEAKNELKRMKRVPPASHEYSVIATYLDWIIDLPWNKSTEDILDIKDAREKLDNDHYGLDKPKKRILEYLAIRKLNPESRSPILCFVGNPGVGKTSIGKSIANAMGREFQRMSLGGVRDEAEIRGHRSTYIGAMPGRILQSIKRAGTNNPVIMLDEIDKLGSDHRGDPSSALLEALDPEQNFAFSDHYLRVKFDLSKVIFITTANLLDTVPPALKDRMEVIKFPGYSQDEKEKIAQQFLIPRQLKEHGLKDITFTKNALDIIINGYTRESGVRNLEREIANIIRFIGCKYVEEDILEKNIRKKDIATYLGIQKYPVEDDISIKKSGVALGMYYSAVGGGLLFFESVTMRMYDKFPQLTVSGNLKDIMRESIIVAFNWIRSNRDLVEKITKRTCNIDKSDVHIHVPEGATPKDGPSAGVAILISLVSLYTKEIPREKTAYTGEITLSGRVLAVGGIKEKVLGAHRAGVTDIVMPVWCENKLDTIPKDVMNTVTFHFINTMDEAIEIAFSKGNNYSELIKKDLTL